MANWDHEITLITPGYSDKDSDGFAIEVDADEDTILARKLPVRSQEFYAAAQSNFTIEQIFEVHIFEYKGQKKLSFEGNEYRVYRTFEKPGHLIELYCSRIDENHNREGNQHDTNS
ncbi:phage head closure protein [Jeotgalibacillus aurantiacus]|uniref:phage head closure protein n=1 Tax=Jeotgalibacillus aurantiacus TaxID=2763266 RepID=UPI001D0A788B|nr:phage head closure protein [Jeotgalibacillus aurantiacus]